MRTRASAVNPAKARTEWSSMETILRIVRASWSLSVSVDECKGCMGVSNVRRESTRESYSTQWSKKRYVLCNGSLFDGQDDAVLSLNPNDGASTAHGLMVMGMDGDKRG